MAMPSSTFVHQILLIESDTRHAELIREAMEKKANLRLHILRDVVTAIRFLAKRDRFMQAPTPDLILVERELPYFSGTALLEERRRRTDWRAIPVVMFSGSMDDRLECLAHGADEHLVKPEDPNCWRPLVDDVLLRHLPLAFS